MKSFLCIVLLCACPAFGGVEDSDSASTDGSAVHPVRLGLVMAGAAGIVTAAHVQSYNSWWKGERRSFHIREDGSHQFGADKLGHFYFTYVAADIMSRSFVWAGVRPSTASLYGGALSLAFQIYVETEDGFTPSLGFSIGDMVANMTGAVYPLLQYHYASLEHVQPKWSVIRSEKFKQGKFRSVIDDYESQYYWLSFNVKELLPDLVPSFWPSFLPIAVGFSVKNIDRRLGGGQWELYVALDYDFRKLPGEGTFLRAVKHVLNYIHIPAPTVRIRPRVTAYGLFGMRI